MTVDTLARICAAMRGEVQVNEPLAGHTSLKVGGPADYFAIPADLADLEDLLKVVQRLSLPCFVIGGGYNVLIGDGGFRGVVISLKRLNGVALNGTRGVRAEAGVLNQQLVKYAIDKGLSGLEFLSCIPGTVGGALSVNAGAHGQSILGVVETLVTLKYGRLTETPAASLDYGYRYLKLEPGEVVVAASFSLAAGNTAEIRAKLEEFRQHRQESQKVSYPNAGSFFKNPEGQQAWRLIDEAGFRGVRVGGAQVAEAHTNFLVNRGGATAADFVRLAETIKERVFERTGIMLQEEVRMLGDFEAH